MEYVNLGKIAKIKTGKLDANAANKNGKYPFFTCSKEPLSINTYSYDCECVLVAGNGDLNVKYYNGKFDAYQRTYIIEILDKSKYNTKYIYLLLISYINALRNKALGGVIKYIKLGNLTSLKVPIIDIMEQEKIVKKLFKLDKVINIKVLQLKTCDNLVKSQFVEMFEAYDEYNLTSLSQCTKFIDYRGHTPKVDEVGEIRMINAKSVGKGYFKYISEYITEELYNEWMHRGFAYPGDVLFVTEGHTFGNTCLIPENIGRFALGQRVITIQGEKNIINNKYLNSYMQTKNFYNRINAYKTGGTAQGIRSKDLLKVIVPVPPIELQNKFAKIVEQIDKQKFVIDNSLENIGKLVDLW